MTLLEAPTIATKHLDAIVHSAASTWGALARRADVVHYHALGPGLMAPVPRYLSRAAVVMTVHGLDHQRDKWGAPARAVLGAAHWMSGRVPNGTVVVSRDLAAHYGEHFRKAVACIPNGVTTPALTDASDFVRSIGLVPGEYALFVGRLVPEKRPDLLIRAVLASDCIRQLAIVGDSSFSDEYSRRLRELAGDDPRIVFPGFVGGAHLEEVFQRAGVFVPALRPRGTPTDSARGDRQRCPGAGERHRSPPRGHRLRFTGAPGLRPRGRRLASDCLGADARRRPGRIRGRPAGPRPRGLLLGLRDRPAGGPLPPSGGRTAGESPVTVVTAVPVRVMAPREIRDVELVLDGILPSGHVLGGRIVSAPRPSGRPRGAVCAGLVVDPDLARLASAAGCLTLVDQEQTPLASLAMIRATPTAVGNDGSADVGDVGDEVLVTGTLTRERLRESGAGSRAGRRPHGVGGCLRRSRRVRPTGTDLRRTAAHDVPARGPSQQSSSSGARGGA